MDENNLLPPKGSKTHRAKIRNGQVQIPVAWRKKYRFPRFGEAILEDRDGEIVLVCPIYWCSRCNRMDTDENAFHDFDIEAKKHICKDCHAIQKTML